MSEVPLLNNPTVASLVGGLAGAFSAFLLVIVNDWRRDKRRIQTIRNEMQLNRQLVEAKIQTLKSNRALLSGHNKLIPAPVLKFTPGIIRGIAVEIFKFSSDQRQALDAICYTMEETDNLIDSALDIVRRFENRFGSSLDPQEEQQLCDRIITLYNDGIVNLGRLVEMCDNYLGRDYRTIVTKRYDRRDYEQ